jgi:hypothetical protein
MEKKILLENAELICSGDDTPVIRITSKPTGYYYELWIPISEIGDLLPKKTDGSRIVKRIEIVI